MNDPFLSEDACFYRLMDDYIKHKTIVIAVDFDNTVFDLHGNGYEFPAMFKLLQEAQELGMKIVAFSASPQERHGFIREHFLANNIILDGINEDVFITWRDSEKDYSRSKIFYNILLCDRAGLPSAAQSLRRVIDTIQILNNTNNE